LRRSTLAPVWNVSSVGCLAGRRTVLRLMDDSNRDRFQRSYERIELAYRQAPVDELPVLIGDVNYWITGEDPRLVPDDYFEDGAFASMLDFQAKKIVAHLARYEDIYIPFLFPWYGTGVVPSALGCSILFQPKEEPAVEGPIIRQPEDVKKLVPPDPHKDGLMPRVLHCIDYLRANSDLPVSFTDNQGPLNIALNLVGVETIFLWMYDYPNIVHELMDFCTTVLIDWVKLQKQHAGQELESGAFPHTVALPKGFGGVWISDDDSTIMSAPLYREFVVPYNSRVLTAFGGGTLHYCGSAAHQLENYRSIEGLTGINAWPMGDFAQIFKAQTVFEDKITLMVCDYTALDMEGYFSELLANLKPKGTILATYPSPRDAVVTGHRTEAVDRDPVGTGLEAWRIIHEHLRSRVRV
jgi:uroporphyrinogen-III decarboxylase